MTVRRLRIGSILLVAIVAAMLAAAGTARGGWFQSEVRVTSSTQYQYQYHPAVSGTRVVYQDDRSGNPDIYLYDLVTRTERRLTTNTARQDYPAISGNRVVWRDSRRANGADIYLYDLTTNIEKRISKSFDHLLGPPRISGTRVVCQQGGSAGGDDIMMYDLVTGFEHRYTVAGNQESPDIDGKKIVYGNRSNGVFDVYLYDIATNTRKRLTTSGRSSGPSISGSKVVYGDFRDGPGNIYLYDLKTGKERRLTTDAADSQSVMISGTNVISLDGRHETDSEMPTTSEVYLYDLNSGIEKLVVALGTYRDRVAISGSRVVYEDVRGGKPDVYLKELAYPRLTASASAAVAYGARAQITGTLTTDSLAGAGEVGLPGKTITLSDSANGSTWRTRGSVQTGAGGAYSIDTPALTKARYFRVSFAGDVDYLGVTFARLRVKPKVQLGRPRVPRRVGLRRTFTAWGTLKPKHAAGSRPVRIKLYQYKQLSDGTPVYVLRRTVRAKAVNFSDYTRYKATLRVTTRGKWAVRAYHAADGANAATSSGWRSFVVR